MIQIRNGRTYAPGAPDLGEGRTHEGWFKVGGISVLNFPDGSFTIEIHDDAGPERLGWPQALVNLPAECKRELVQARKGDR